MSLRTFRETPIIIDNLSLIYNKDSIIENFIAYVRENQIRNESVLMSEDNVRVGSNFFIYSSFADENKYKNMRRNLHSSFKGME